MAADLTAFRAKFSNAPFAAMSATVIKEALDEAKLLHSIRDVATLYCAAHLLILDQENLTELGQAVTAPDGGAGVVTAESIGPRNISYLTQAGDDERRAFFVTTPYGRRFLALEDRSPRATIGARVIG